MRSSEEPLRVAVIGAGPSGLYAADHLLGKDIHVEIDIFDRMPTPWGLVRYGVAPDHPERKQVIDRRFDAVINHPSVSYFGNVEVGRDVNHEQLSQAYHAVIYAIGCADDRRLNIPGEDLPGCWGAREFVAWYNGHPDFSHLEFDLSSERAVVIGNGNVAIDIARILLKDPDTLARTDMSDTAIAALKQSQVKEVTILGRRGCLQASLHSQMLAEAAELPGVSVQFENDTDFVSTADPESDTLQWANKRKLQVMGQIKSQPEPENDKKIIFRFFGAPIELIGDKKVEGLKIAKTHLEQDPNGKLVSVSTDDVSDLATGLVFRSIGYKGKPLLGLPFDPSKGIVPNHQGRVIQEAKPLNGTYVTGWIKRGPSGVIGSNRKCAAETIDCLVDDARNDQLSIDEDVYQSLHAWLSEKESPSVSIDGWKKIDAREVEHGRLHGRPRIKITNKAELMACASR